MTMLPPVPGTPAGMPQVPNAQADAVSGAYVDLTVQGGYFTAGITPPRVLVNGWQVAAPYRRSTVPVPAGPCRVDIFSYVARRRSSLEFTARPQQHVPVYYGPPGHNFVDGAIRHTEQRRPGMWFIALAWLFAISAVSWIVFW